MPRQPPLSATVVECNSGWPLSGGVIFAYQVDEHVVNDGGQLLQPARLLRWQRFLLHDVHKTACHVSPKHSSLCSLSYRKGNRGNSQVNQTIATELRISGLEFGKETKNLTEWTQKERYGLLMALCCAQYFLTPFLLMFRFGGLDANTLFELFLHFVIGSTATWQLKAQRTFGGFLGLLVSWELGI